MTDPETKKPTVVHATEIWRNEDEICVRAEILGFTGYSCVPTNLRPPPGAVHIGEQQVPVTLESFRACAHAALWLPVIKRLAGDELSLVEAEAERAALALGGRSSAEQLSPKPEAP